MAARAVRRRPAARVYQMRGVRLFASGTYRGEDWPPAVIDEIAANAGKLGPEGLRLLVPPSVLGHEEDQQTLAEFLERTDMPAAGWVDPSSVRSVPDPQFPGHRILVGNVVNIPPAIAAQLERGTYKFGSAEIYDNFRDDFGAQHGRVLRRFALLGGEVPQVKRLGSLPRVEPMDAPIPFSERARAIRVRTQRTNGRTHYYAESVMDRNAMVAAITAAMPGIAQATLETMSEEQLADLLKNLPGAGGMATPSGPAGPSAAPNMQPNGMFAEGDAPPPEGDEAPTETESDEPDAEEMREALIDWGQDPAEVDAMSDEEVMAMYDEMAASQDAAGAAQPTTDMADAMDAATQTPAGVPPGTMSRDDMIAELVAAGQDAAQLEGMSDAEIAQLYAQIGAAPQSAPQPAAAAMSDRPNPRSSPVSTTRRGAARRPVAPKPSAPNPSAPFSDREARQLTANARELDAVVRSELARLKRNAMKDKRKAAAAFCDKLVHDGKYTRAQVKAVVFPLLLQLDNQHAVHRYSEGGVTKSGTAFERKMAELDAGEAVVRFGERVGGPQVSGPAAATNELNTVRRFSETIPDATLRASGTTREKFVAAFAELQKKNPALTAEQYIGAPAASSSR